MSDFAQACISKLLKLSVLQTRIKLQTFQLRQLQWRLSVFAFIKNCGNKLHDFKPFQRKTSALRWSSPPLSTPICSQLFLIPYLPSYPTFTKFHFAGFPAYPSPCLFSLMYNSNVVVAFVPVFTASQAPIQSLPCLHCTQDWVSSTHLSRPALA